MEERADPGVIRLSVPAEPDFVAVLRVVARLIAGRSGHHEDARMRLQAAAGTAFFAVLEGAPRDSTVVALLSADPERVELTLVVPPEGKPLTSVHVADLGVPHTLSPDGRSLRLWVDS